MKKMRLCKSCGRYTLEENHCSSTTASAHPQRYNPNDKYAKYRRVLKGIS